MIALPKIVPWKLFAILFLAAGLCLTIPMSANAAVLQGGRSALTTDTSAKVLASASTLSAQASRGSASYTIKTYKTVNKYTYVKAKHLYQMPFMKGKSAAAKAINKSTKKAYRATLDSKATLMEYARGFSAKPYGKSMTYYTTTVKVTYNKNGLISFRYHRKWWGGGAVATSSYKGDVYSLATGDRLNVAQLVGKDAETVKQLIAKKYEDKYFSTSYNSYAYDTIMKTDIDDFECYLSGNKVIVCFDSYPPGYVGQQIRWTVALERNAVNIKDAEVYAPTIATYTGKPIKPAVTVVHLARQLAPGLDYTVAYRNAKGVKVSAPKARGTYKITIKGKGSFKGSVTRTFKIVKTTAKNKAKAADAKALSAYGQFLAGSCIAYGDGSLTPSSGRLADYDGATDGFSVYDLNGDGVKELFVYGGGQINYTKVFTFKDNKIRQIRCTTNVAPYTNKVIRTQFSSGFGYTTYTYLKLTKSYAWKTLFQYTYWAKDGGTYRTGKNSYDEATPVATRAAVDEKVSEVVGAGVEITPTRLDNTSANRRKAAK